MRCTFKEPINIQLSLASTRYYIEHAGQFNSRQRVYLWLYDEALWEAARSFLPTVRGFKLPVEELSRDQLKAKFSLLGDVSDLAGATLTPFDGRLSPHKLRLHYINRAQAGGVEMLDRVQVVGVEGARPPYVVTLRRVTPRSIKQTLIDGVAAPRPRVTTEELTLEAEHIVNAAGPWAAEIATLYGRTLPIKPLPRQVFLLKHPSVNLEPLPFFIDYPQDIYFRHYLHQKSDCVLVSWSDPNERPAHNFAHHGAAYNAEHVGPRVEKRLPALRDAEMAGGWVGHYELSPDKGAILGDVPNRPGIFNYNGLSAHGVMQSYAIGDSLAEFLVHRRWAPDLDLGILNESRFAAGVSFRESMYV